MAFLDPVLGPLVGWLLSLHPLVALALISAVVSLLVTLATKFFTDQDLLKSIREEMKELQRQMRELRNHPDKMAKVSQQNMELTTKMMMQNYKVMFLTIIPSLLIFAWLSSHMAYYQIEPGTQFTLTAHFDRSVAGNATLTAPPENITFHNSISHAIIPGQEEGTAAWALSGKEGAHTLTLEVAGRTYSIPLVISAARRYGAVEQSFKGGFFSRETPALTKVNLGNRPVRPFADVPLFKDIPWINERGWLFTYFVLQLIFTLGFKRLLKVY